MCFQLKPFFLSASTLPLGSPPSFFWGGGEEILWTAKLCYNFCVSWLKLFGSYLVLDILRSRMSGLNPVKLVIVLKKTILCTFF